MLRFYRTHLWLSSLILLFIAVENRRVHLQVQRPVSPDDGGAAFCEGGEIVRRIRIDLQPPAELDVEGRFTRWLLKCRSQKRG